MGTNVWCLFKSLAVCLDGKRRSSCASASQHTITAEHCRADHQISISLHQHRKTSRLHSTRYVGHSLFSHLPGIDFDLQSCWEQYISYTLSSMASVIDMIFMTDIHLKGHKPAHFASSGGSAILQQRERVKSHSCHKCETMSEPKWHFYHCSQP